MYPIGRLFPKCCCAFCNMSCFPLAVTMQSQRCSGIDFSWRVSCLNNKEFNAWTNHLGLSWNSSGKDQNREAFLCSWAPICICAPELFWIQEDDVLMSPVMGLDMAVQCVLGLPHLLCFSTLLCAGEVVSHNILTIKAGGNHTALPERHLKKSVSPCETGSAHEEENAAARYLLRWLVSLCAESYRPTPRKGTEHQRCCRFQGNCTQLEKSVPLVYTVGSLRLHSYLTIPK